MVSLILFIIPATALVVNNILTAVFLGLPVLKGKETSLIDIDIGDIYMVIRYLMIISSSMALLILIIDLLRFNNEYVKMIQKVLLLILIIANVTASGIFFFLDDLYIRKMQKFNKTNNNYALLILFNIIQPICAIGIGLLRFKFI